MITVGLYFALLSTVAIKEVVVVFPCDPEIAIVFFKLAICDSASAREIIGIFLVLDSFNSLLDFLIALE